MRSLRRDFLDFQWDGNKRNVEQARAVRTGLRLFKGRFWQLLTVLMLLRYLLC